VLLGWLARLNVLGSLHTLCNTSYLSYYFSSYYSTYNAHTLDNKMTIASLTDPTMDPDSAPVAPPPVNLPPPLPGEQSKSCCSQHLAEWQGGQLQQRNHLLYGDGRWHRHLNDGLICPRPSDHPTMIGGSRQGTGRHTLRVHRELLCWSQSPGRNDHSRKRTYNKHQQKCRGRNWMND
jgi:hypothetical protein